jgi:hypothetical protein
MALDILYLQLLVKEYEEEIKALRMELAMHDTLVSFSVDKSFQGGFDRIYGVHYCVSTRLPNWQ